MPLNNRIADRQTGQEHPETIHVPGRFFYPVSTQPGYLQHSHVGNFFPLGGTGALYGISLLERKLLWTTVPEMARGEFSSNLQRGMLESGSYRTERILG